VQILPNCVLLAELQARRPDTAERLEGAPSLLSVSRLDPVKALDDAIAAIARPELSGAVLHLVGRGPDLPRLQAAAERAGVAGRVRFHGWKSDAEAAAMLAGADLFVLPSHREGMPTALLEALLSGVPAVCSDIAGCRAIAGPAGWHALYTPGDVAGLAAAAVTWAGRPVPDTVRARLAELFTWERRAGELATLYRRLG
jgi:glycosyltransferase involved in cell wall biosynthesis